MQAKASSETTRPSRIQACRLPPLELRLVRKGAQVAVKVVPVFPVETLASVGAAPATEPAGRPHYRIGVQIADADQTLRDQLSLSFCISDGVAFA